MERQRIVVGIDGSDNARSALKWAYAEASLRKAILQPVMVWSYPYYVMPPDAMVLSEAFESVGSSFSNSSVVRGGEATSARL